MNMPVMISYSSIDREFTRELSESLRLVGVEILLDETFLDGGDPVLERIEEMVESARVLIAVLSRQSLKSRWVRLEQALFAARMAGNPDLRVIPILLEDCEIPQWLQNFSVLDFTSPANYQADKSNLVEQLRSIGLGLGRITHRTSTRLSQHQGKQFEDLIESAVDRGMTRLKEDLSFIVDTFHKHQYLLTPQTIAAKEREAKEEIWVVTTHLYNDTQDEEFKKSVIANFRREISYVYFIDGSDLIQKRRKRYDKIYGEFRGHYRFITLPSGILMPFDEVVLYEPREIRCWGYAQMKYPLPTGQAGDDLFLKLPTANAIANAKALESFLNAAPAESSTSP